MSQRQRSPEQRRRPKPGPRRTSRQDHGRVSRRTGGRGKPTGRVQRPPVRATRPKRKEQPAEGRQLLRILTTLVARALLGLVILAVFVFGVLPTGSYFEQRDQLNDAERELQDLQGQNAELEARIARLESDAEIERVARKEFDMVLPEEESYLVLPPGR